MIVPPAFFDDGYDGSWLETLSFLPWTPLLCGGLANAAFQISKDAARESANALASKPSPFSHATPDSPGGQRDHA